MQKAIDDASEQALIARQQSKTHHQSPRRHRPHAAPTTGPSNSTFSPAYSTSHPTVTFDLRTTHTLDNGNELLASDKFQSIRSPSMLQLQDHTPSSTSTLRRREGEVARESVKVSRKPTGVDLAMEPERVRARGGTRGSRIPVRSQVREKYGRSGRSNTNVAVHRAGRGEATAQHNQRITRDTSHTHLRRSSTLPGNGSTHDLSRAEHVRVASPPVPALAKRLGQQGVAHTQAKKLPSSYTPPSPEPATPTQVGVVRQMSPPVPALRKKLKNGVTPTEPTSAATIPQNASHTPHATSHTLPAIQPPVRTRKDGHTQLEKGVVSAASHTHLPPIVSSTEKIGKPHPPINSVILQELAELRKVSFATNSHDIEYY